MNDMAKGRQVRRQDLDNRTKLLLECDLEGIDGANRLSGNNWLRDENTEVVEVDCELRSFYTALDHKD